MDHLRVAPAAGIVACVAVLGALLLPYALAEQASAVGGYYGSGAINPLLAGLFALVLVIVLAAGREGRTDRGLAAGAALAFGVAAAVVAVAWATTARIDVPLAFPLVSYHRWLVALPAFAVPLCAGWYARALGLL